jgi:type IX secretion system PorP/SprF family membrane protein
MRRVLSILLIFWMGQTLAQQDPMYSLYMFNGLTVNPAYAGSASGTVVNLHSRQQWVGMEGAPKTMSANLSTRYFRDQLGTGLNFYNDRIGVFNRNVLSLSQAYHLRLSKVIVSGGLQVSLEQWRANFSGANSSVDGVIDPTFQGNLAQSNLNIGAGVYVYNNRFWVGYSVPHLMKTQWSKTTTALTPAYQTVHQFASAGMVIPFHSRWEFKPSVLAKIQEKSGVNVEADAMVYYNRILGIGGGYRMGSAYIGLVEFQLGKYARLMYAYDRSQGSMEKFTYGSHEFMLKFFLSNNYRGQDSPRMF